MKNDPEATVLWRSRDHEVELVDRTTIFAPAMLARGSSPAPLVLPPPLEREVFQLARRVALQANLDGAVRVLRDGVARLTGSGDVACVLYDATSDGGDDAQRLVARAAREGRAFELDSTLLEPIGPAPSRAVLVLRRATPYTIAERAVITAIARAAAGIVDHFIADHHARAEQAARDAKTPFRPQVLAERRRAIAAPARVLATPRAWVRWAFPALLAMVASAIVTAVFVQVPMYSTGFAIVTLDGERVTAAMPGTVAEILVAANATVAAGDPLVRMHSVQEDAELAASEVEYRSALATFLTDPGDNAAHAALGALATRRQRARAAVEAHTLHATAAGVVEDIRVHPGELVVPGAELLKIAPAGMQPSVVALLPGFDRPRLAPGMTVQMELPGYRAKRVQAVVEQVGAQVVGPEEARRSLGDPIGDALPITGSVVIVRARLEATTFEAGGREFELHDGMVGKAEVRVDHKSLLRALLGSEGE